MVEKGDVMIGIIFAMKEELDEFLKLVNNIEEKKIFDLTFYECSLENKKLVLVESGVGKVNAARTTQVLIDKMNVDFIFNIGVAGSVSESVNVLDIVIGTRQVQHDFDITAFDHEKGYIPNVGVYISSNDSLLDLARSIKVDANIHEGVIASGDIFVTNPEMSRKIFTKFNALAVEMEGASIAQVCYLCNIPYLVIRSISDSPNVNDNNKLTYEEFLEKSSIIVANYLKKIILNIK